MKKDDELWLKKIKERLDDYSEPLPDLGWERLEKDLLASTSMTVGKGKQVLFRRWAMTAAAVALVAVSSVSLWLLQSPVVDDVRRSAEPVFAAMPDVMPEPAKPAVEGEQVVPVVRRVMERGTYSQPSLVAEQLDTEHKESAVVLPDATDISAEPMNNIEEDNQTIQATGSSSPSTEKKERGAYRPSGKDKLHLPADKKSTSVKKGWSVGLSVGNTGGLSSMDSDLGAESILNGGSSTPMFSDKMDLTSASNGIVGIPGGQQLIFSNGVPYLRGNTRVVKDIKHRQPLSFGVSVRKALPKNFSVETGVTYTLLSSEITYEGISEKADQKLHYIGIPVRANWNFVNNKHFTMYVSAGGAIEKCVYGKVDGETETVKPLQLSVMGAVGAQYNVSNRVGIYVEPGVSYFFDDGSSMETIRKENPTNFTLQAGIRLTY